MQHADPEVGAAHQVGAAAVQEAFAPGTDVDGCVRLARSVDHLADQAGGAFREEGIACRAGCHFCCHLRVMVRPHEAIALFRSLGTTLPAAQARRVRQRVQANAARVASLGPAGHAAARMPCAFLVDGVCSAYDARPLACAGYHSLDRLRCEQDEQASGTTSNAGGIPMLRGLISVMEDLDAGVDAGLARRQLDAGRIELHEAVAALLKNPALIARWRAGREFLPHHGANAGRDPAGGSP